MPQASISFLDRRISRGATGLARVTEEHVPGPQDAGLRGVAPDLYIIIADRSREQ